MTDDIATLTSERDALRQRVNALEQESSNDKIGEFCADLRTCGLKPPYLFESKAGDFYVIPTDKNGEPVEIALAAILAENAHLKTQRDQLQRDCTRFEQEARDAREQLRKIQERNAAEIKVKIDMLEQRSEEIGKAIDRATKPFRHTVANWRIDPITEGGFILVRDEDTVAEIAPFGTLGWYRFTALSAESSIRGESGLGILHVLNKCERIVGITCDRSAIAHLLSPSEPALSASRSLS